MSNHPLTVEGWNGSLDDLAQAIGRMRYDKVAEFYACLAEEFCRQANGDRAAGRRKLAALLDCATEIARHGNERFDEIWKLCEPFEPQRPNGAATIGPTGLSGLTP